MNHCKGIYKKDAFTMIEMLLSLLISIIMTYMLIISVRGFYQYTKTKQLRMFDQIVALKQMSYYINKSTDIQVSSDSVCFVDEKNENFCFSQNENRIVKTPGFDILLHDVTKTYFYLKDNDLYISFQIGNNDVEYLITNITRKKKEIIIDEIEDEYEEE